MSVGTGGGEDFPEAVEDLEDCVWAGGFGTVPKVEGVREDGTVLVGDGDEDEVKAGAAEVLALGALTFGIGTAAGVIVGAEVGLVVVVSLARTAAC